jgi:hypothetical protein
MCAIGLGATGTIARGTSAAPIRIVLPNSEPSKVDICVVSITRNKVTKMLLD